MKFIVEVGRSHLREQGLYDELTLSRPMHPDGLDRHRLELAKKLTRRI